MYEIRLLLEEKEQLALDLKKRTYCHLNLNEIRKNKTGGAAQDVILFTRFFGHYFLCSVTCSKCSAFLKERFLCLSNFCSFMVLIKACSRLVLVKVAAF